MKAKVTRFHSNQELESLELHLQVPPNAPRPLTPCKRMCKPPCKIHNPVSIAATPKLQLVWIQECVHSYLPAHNVHCPTPSELGLHWNSPCYIQCQLILQHLWTAPISQNNNEDNYKASLLKADIETTVSTWVNKSNNTHSTITKWTCQNEKSIPNHNIIHQINKPKMTPW
jgi:hypothetical protein